MKPLKIGDLAKLADIKSGTIRYYEKIGLLPKPELSESGYRQYYENSIKAIKFIMHAKEIGFSLKDISELLSINKSDHKNSCNKIKKMTEIKINELNKRIDASIALKNRLIKLKNLCEKNSDDNECPVIDILDEN